MQKAMTVMLAMSLAITGCGMTIQERIIATSELKIERKPGVGNASLSAALLEAKPPLDLNRTK